MKIYIVNCDFNASRTLTDCAFKNEADAKAYADALNGDKTKAVARCRELIALREGEEGIKFLDEAGRIAFGILPVDCK